MSTPLAALAEMTLSPGGRPADGVAGCTIGEGHAGTVIAQGVSSGGVGADVVAIDQVVVSPT